LRTPLVPELHPSVAPRRAVRLVNGDEGEPHRHDAARPKELHVHLFAGVVLVERAMPLLAGRDAQWEARGVCVTGQHRSAEQDADRHAASEIVFFPLLLSTSRLMDFMPHLPWHC
jgi:hypothetical protein